MVVPEAPPRPFRTAALGLLAAGLVLAQHACSSAPPAAAPTAAPSPSPSAPATSPPPTGAPATATSSPSAGGSTEDILDGDRQVALKPHPGAGSVLAVDTKGRLDVTDGPGAYSRFVLTKVGDRHQIRTAEADPSGERSCMGIKSNGEAPLTVVAAVCDASSTGQLFRLRDQEEAVDGRPTYTIAGEGGVFLQVTDGYGLIAEEAGDGTRETVFSFVDNGPAPLPPTG